MSFVHPERGVLDRVEVGAAPWGIALAPDSFAYVATAEGVAIVNTRRRTREALVQYPTEVDEPRYGEYRPGGMGIAVSPDGRRVYLAVYVPDGPSRLEVLDTGKREMVGSVPVGLRPFQVLVSRDGRSVYTIDHDSFSVTVVDAISLRAKTLEVAPLGERGGLSSFDKPHYAALRGDGHLLLPYQGRVLQDLDPTSGRSTARPLEVDTHQHGVYLTPDERRLYMVGTGPAGQAERGPNLAILDLESGEESVIPLSRPHENVAVSPNGRWAYLTGGYTFANGGWDGITVVDLRERTIRELRVPGEPLDIALLP